MGFTDSPMRIDHPTIYEVWHVHLSAEQQQQLQLQGSVAIHIALPVALHIALSVSQLQPSKFENAHPPFRSNI